MSISSHVHSSTTRVGSKLGWDLGESRQIS